MPKESIPHAYNHLSYQFVQTHKLQTLQKAIEKIYRQLKNN